MTAEAAGLAEGVRNLLVNCCGLRSGMRLLIVAEPEAGRYYDPGLAPAVAAAAERLGISARVRREPFNPAVADPGPGLSAAMDAADRVLFLARLGDQLRFRPSVADRVATMCYALDRTMLASAFGRVRHQSMEALRALLDGALAAAREVHVTCPAGTDFRGPGARFPGASGETSVRRFPVSVVTPVPAGGFSGQVAQVGFLCATGSQTYDPPACEIRGTLRVRLEGRHIAGFSGDAADVARAEAHYDRVAGLFGLDRSFVHSWHPGIHPGLAYPMAPARNFDRWSNGAFGNPRVLHFHTCGRYAPGEISLNVVDPTIRLDGVAVWEGGVLHPARVPGGASLLSRAPDLAAAFGAPSREIGLGPSNRLSYREEAPAPLPAGGPERPSPARQVTRG